MSCWRRTVRALLREHEVLALALVAQRVRMFMNIEER